MALHVSDFVVGSSRRSSASSATSQPHNYMNFAPHEGFIGEMAELVGYHHFKY